MVCAIESRTDVKEKEQTSMGRLVCITYLMGRWRSRRLKMKKVCCLLALGIPFIIMACDSGDLMSDMVEEGSGNSFPATVTTHQTRCPYVASLNSEVFHFWNCFYVDRMKKEDKICFANTRTAMNSGRQSCTLCVDSVIYVYVTIGGEAAGIYHTNRNCKHLDHLTEEGKNELIRMVSIWDPEFRRCKDCDEERHTEE